MLCSSNSIPRAFACSISSLLASREAAAISDTPAINPQKPEPVPLVSSSKPTWGCSLPYSAMSRGANSSPMVFEPLIVTFWPEVVAAALEACGCGAFSSEQPARRRNSTTGMVLPKCRPPRRRKTEAQSIDFMAIRHNWFGKYVRAIFSPAGNQIKGKVRENNSASLCSLCRVAWRRPGLLSDPQVVLSVGVVGLEPDGLFELGDGFVQAAFAAQGDAQMAMGLRIFGVKSDGGL